MSLDKYKQQLIREAKKSPKKAVALGSLLVLALWFWAPLVGGWMSGGSDQEEATAEKEESNPVPPFAKQNIGSDEQGQAVKSVERAKAPRIEWNQLTEWIKSDPLMSPAQLAVDSRDPFLAHLERSLAEEELETEVEEKAEPVQALVTPKSVGLTLTSTIVGSKRRVAMIGGKAYLQGKTIYVLAGGKRIGFLLAEVGTRHVVLTRDERHYELTIQSTGLASGLGVDRLLPNEE